MFTPARRAVLVVLVGAFLLLGQTGAAIAASPPAGATLTAAPSVITAAVQPGDQGTTTLTLSAGQDLDILVDPQGLGQAPEDGSFVFLPADEDQSQYTARPFITVDPSSFRLEAGDSRDVTVTVSVPAGAGDGDRYALLKINGQPLPGSGNVGIGVALGVSVLVTLPDTSQTRTGSIKDLIVGSAIPGQPVSLTGLIQNTGNSHYGAVPNAVYQTATLRSQSGEQLATATETLSGNSIIPTLGRRFDLALAPGQALAAGRYQVDVEVGLEDGTVLDQATANLEVPGGAVLPVTGGPSEDQLAILPSLLGAAMGVLLLLLYLRRRKPRQRTASE